MAAHAENIYENPVKMFICDIHKLERNESDSNYYHFKNKIIRKVDIMGIVTEVRKINDFYLYRVDDCTGEILCKYNHHCEKNLQALKETEKLQDMVAARNFKDATECGAIMEFILEDVFQKNTITMNPLEQGDCAHLQGFISDYFGTREIWAFKMGILKFGFYKVNYNY